MPTFYSFPSISQFKDNVQATTSTIRFSGFDSVGNPQYDYSLPLPVEEYIGFVKVHGTNAGICFNPKNGNLYAQSRNNVLSEKRDNCGFNIFVMNNKDFFIDVLSTLTKDKPVVAYGEWFGAGIQKGVAVASLQRRLMIFAVKIVDDSPKWLGKEAIQMFNSPKNFIWNVYDFPTFKIVIDYNNPQLSQKQLAEITNQVEKECPVGKYFGVSGIGEGVVWYNEKYGRFKVKGEEHSSSKVKTLASVDNEKVSSIAEFVEYAVTENRLNQGIEQVFTTQNERPNVKYTKQFIIWITNDVFKEESTTLTENGLIPENVGKAIGEKARNWFIAFVKKIN